MQVLTLFALHLLLKFHSSSFAADKQNSQNVLQSVRVSEDDSFAKRFLSEKAPAIGLLEKDSFGLKIDLFYPPVHSDGNTIYITFDGKIRGKVQLHTKGDYPTTVPTTIPLPKPPSRPDTLPGDIYVVTSLSQFKDPASWKARVPLGEVQRKGKQIVAAHLRVLVCKASGKKSGPSPMVPMSDLSALKFVKGYSNIDGEYLLGFSIIKSKVKLPKEHIWCGEYANDGMENGRVFLQVQERAVFWAFQSDKQPSVFLGRGVPIDAGDYDGDGKSEFVFYLRADGITSYWAGDARVFDSNFQKYFEAQIGRF